MRPTPKHSGCETSALSAIEGLNSEVPFARADVNDAFLAEPDDAYIGYSNSGEATMRMAQLGIVSTAVWKGGSRMDSSFQARIALLALLLVCGGKAMAQSPPKTVSPDGRQADQEKIVAAAPGRSDFSSIRKIQNERGKEQFAKEGSEKDIDYLRAYLQYLQQRAYPNDSFDKGAYLRAVEHMKLMKRPTVPTSIKRPPGGRPELDSSQPFTWQFFGPRNAQFEGTNISGRINAVAYDPNQANVIWAGSAGGGVWRSFDGGGSWFHLSDGWPLEMTSSIAVDPLHSDTVYVGTGDFQGGVGSGFGVMKTTDGGNNWTLLGANTLANAEVAKVLVDPENTQIVTVAATNGLWRSINGGTTWNAVLDMAGNAIVSMSWSDVEQGARDAQGNRSYYAIGEGGAGYVYRSQDRGGHWVPLSFPFTSGKSQFGLAVAPSPITPGNVYVMSGAEMKVWMSTTSGNDWTEVTGNLTQVGWDWNQSWYDWFLKCSSEGTNDTLYIGLKHIFQARSAGSWNQLSRPHDDQHALEINPHDPNEMLLGNDGGIYRATYKPGSSDWNTIGLNNALGVTLIYKSATSPDTQSVILGTQDNGTVGALGDLTKWKYLVGGDSGFAAIDSAKPGTQYATRAVGAYGLLRTEDNWNHNSEITPPGASGSPMTPVILDPNLPRIMYWGNNYLYQWDDDHKTWVSQLGGQKLANCDGCYVSIASVAPGDSFRIYAGTNDGELWATLLAGLAWKQINSGTTKLPSRYITSLSVDPTDQESLLVGISGSGTGHVWKTDNATEDAVRTWTDISGSGTTGLPDVSLNAIVRDPGDPKHSFFVGTDLGVFYTRDAGANWYNATIPLGLPSVIVNDLTVLSNGELQAATFGRGIWRIPMAAMPCVNSGPFFPMYAQGDQGNGIGGYNLTSPADRAFAFDYDHSGKQDHIALYRPGTGTMWILKNTVGTFAPVYHQGDPGNGIGGYDLKSAADQAFAFDYDHSGKQDHIALYRPGTGTMWILKNTGGTFTPVYQQGDPGNEIGGYDLKSTADQAFAFDYDHSGKQDHIALYRPGTGTMWILKNTGGTFTPVYRQGDPGCGIAGYDLKSLADRAFGFDYDGSGVLDHLILYRPGRGAIWIATHP
jgi:hypothetical protein